MHPLLSQFSEVWCADFEFHAPTGERPLPICLVAREIRSGAVLRMWQDELEAAPSPFGAASLFVAYYASAELGCFEALGWAMPNHVLDLYAEFRCATNGKSLSAGRGLLGALSYHGLDAIAAAEKSEMRELAMRGGPFTETERAALLDYCQSDVEALGSLLGAMADSIDIPRALLRGRYTAAAARMEWSGVPVDVALLEQLRQSWEPIKRRLIQEVDAEYGVFVPTGQRRLDPASPTDAVIIERALSMDVDAQALAAAVDYEWRMELESGDGARRAVVDARKTTGWTPNRINRWEDSGKDHSSAPGFDTVSRSLAGIAPSLGIGPGFEQGGGYDSNDYGGRLWELLRDSDTRRPKKTDRKILDRAAARIEAGVVDEAGSLSFSSAKFAEWLIREGIAWPELPSGELDLSDDTFRQMARRHPRVAPLRELRHSLSQLRLNELSVGSDGRNRCLLSMFAARTGRNQPSNSKFIFGPSVWLRGLITPEPGTALAYIDWSAQEIGIAAALSGDVAMRDAYDVGDPYLWLAKAGEYAPETATKQSHGDIRDVFKIVYLAANYGMQETSLGQLVGKPPAYARELLRLHRRCFPKFWAWSDGALNFAKLYGHLWTVFGWRLFVGSDTRSPSLRNFPVQANGAEMLRLACCLGTERGIKVCAPVHDAVLIEGPEDSIDDVVADMQAAMLEASRIVLDGFELRTDAKVVRHGERYMDQRGVMMFETVMGLLERVGAEKELVDVPF